jgi:RHS repeat-associated protein
VVSGPVRGDPGGFGSPFTFTGEMTDANDLLYLRARYYNPALGVFTALDPLEGNAQQAMSLNRYGYVQANVVNAVDASGMFAELPVMWDKCRYQKACPENAVAMLLPGLSEIYVRKQGEMWNTPFVLKSEVAINHGDQIATGPGTSLAILDFCTQDSRVRLVPNIIIVVEHEYTDIIFGIHAEDLTFFKRALTFSYDDLTRYIRPTLSVTENLITFPSHTPVTLWFSDAVDAHPDVLSQINMEIWGGDLTIDYYQYPEPPSFHSPCNFTAKQAADLTLTALGQVPGAGMVEGVVLCAAKIGLESADAYIENMSEQSAQQRIMNVTGPCLNVVLNGLAMQIPGLSQAAAARTVISTIYSACAQ